MKFLIKSLVVFLVFVVILGVSYSVLNPILESLGVEIGNIFDFKEDEKSGDTSKSDETTVTSTETTVPAECNHEYDDDKWICKDENKHFKLCKLCGKGEKTDVHTYDSDGICSGCGNVKADGNDTDAHECDLTKLSSVTTEEYHIYVCSDSGCTLAKKMQEAHDYTGVEWITVTSPTCIDNGQEKRACTICNRVVYRYITELGHSYSEGYCVRCGREDPNYSSGGSSSGESDSSSGESCSHNWEYSGGATPSICSVCGLECIHSNAIYDYDYFPIDDVYHDFWVYCPDCDIRDYGSSVNGFSSHYPHNYNSSGYCFVCGHTQYGAIPL